MGSLKHMIITGYTDKEFQNRFAGKPYVVMINPESIKWQRGIEYDQNQPPGTSSGSPEYKFTPSDKLNFDIVIDCTGVVDSKRVNMKDEIEALEKIVYEYDGKIHSPNFVKVQWGGYIFKGVLESMDVNYTYFKPDGSPLRAKLSLGFKQYVSPETQEKLDKKESPDMTHLVETVDGETLPQLCGRIWNNESYYIQLAMYNKLNKFRNLKGGEKLIFPPITPSA